MSRQRPTGRFIHYEPVRTDYTISEAELEKLRKGEQPLWKDIVLVTIPLAISTLVNAVVETGQRPDFQVTLPLFLNYVTGILSLMLAVIFSIAWYRARQEFASVIEAIKAKPRFEVPPGVFDLGSLQSRGPQADPS
jgi:hypothetical protein